MELITKATIAFTGLAFMAFFKLIIVRKISKG